ncbi:hypothetical protein AVEN_161357-1 [Araneus ventricosus]|uniref:Uncharacterized protein n=1 Tax=Araneus ventricosus TaxID=182803 RepID=A0A4Y2WZ23_ARAVE|nr:hypothetical protein AVEN_161357-1 [Araneus ventricosus]
MAAPYLLHQALPHSKVYDHFIAQSLHVSAHIQMRSNTLRICTQHNYRFLDIHIISNKLGVAPVVHHLTVMFISQYPPPDIGNSFCLVVKMLDSGPKGPRL